MTIDSFDKRNSLSLLLIQKIPRIRCCFRFYFSAAQRGEVVFLFFSYRAVIVRFNREKSAWMSFFLSILEQLKIFCFVINNRLNNSLCEFCSLLVGRGKECSSAFLIPRSLRCNYKVSKTFSIYLPFSLTHAFNRTFHVHQPQLSDFDSSARVNPTAIKWSNKFKLFALGALF